MAEESIPVLRSKRNKSKPNKKLLLLIYLFFISIFVIIFFNSSLSKVSSVKIEGNHFLTQEQIHQAADVKAGDPFFRIHNERIEERIMQLSMASSVEVKRSFPGQVTIAVIEYPHVAFEWNNNELQAVLANGTPVVLNRQPEEIDKPILTGWDEYKPLKKILCEKLSLISKEFIADISEITPSPTDVYADRILFYSRSSYEVITTIGKLEDKLSYFHKIVEKLQQDEVMTGQIIMLEADIHRNFDTPSQEE